MAKYTFSESLKPKKLKAKKFDKCQILYKQKKLFAERGKA